MGLSFTFLSPMIMLASRDFGIMIGAVMVGGCIEGILGLTAKYWRRYITPVVSACVVTTIIYVGNIHFFCFSHYQFTSNTILQFRYRGVNILRVRNNTKYEKRAI